jgi:serine/threonine protein kinase
MSAEARIRIGGADHAAPAGYVPRPHEILATVGAGGRGEVYRARDTRLERTVAAKLLPAHLSLSPRASALRAGGEDD